MEKKENFEERIDPEILNVFPYNFLKRNCFLPVKGENEEIVIVTDDPFKIDIGEIKKIIKKDITIAIAPSDKIQECLEKFYYRPTSSKRVIDDLKEEEDIINISEEDIPETTNLLDLANKAPVIRIVNQIIYRAISMRASDVHIQAAETEVKIRYRIDGVLHDIFVLPKRFHPAIISRVKIISNLDIAEKRVPQDGRTSIKVDSKKVDVRISIIPTFFGESAVLRLLDRNSYLFSLSELGFSKENYEKFNKLITCDHGIVLLTGPTGSGKTTTLYGALSKINNPGINIITLEDPVEYNLEGINQIFVNPRVGLTFANGLRAILRHDPNVIMVGEIRDVETAEMAIQASLTGHLVFSTLHTNDSASAIVRLIDMGIEPYLIASSLIGVMAQRLVRINCQDCCQPITPPLELLKEISLDEEDLIDGKFMEGKGCQKCYNEGYYGRTGIFELLVIDDTIRDFILERESSQKIKAYAIKNGMKTLRVDGAEKVKQGVTTISEVLRVTQEF